MMVPGNGKTKVHILKAEGNTVNGQRFHRRRRKRNIGRSKEDSDNLSLADDFMPLIKPVKKSDKILMSRIITRVRESISEELKCRNIMRLPLH